VTGEDYDRTPPHDLGAEQCALGGMMLSKDAITDVLDVIKSPRDFYRPAHQLVFGAVLDLFSRGDPADAVAVGAELARKGELVQMGGAPYLHTLIAAVPTAANAGYYARIVAERAAFRRLIETGTRIVQTGYAGDVEPGQAFDAARNWLDTAAGTGDDSTGHDVGPLMWEVLGSIEAPDSETPGLPTSLSDLDAVLNRLRRKQLIVIAARPGGGKSALALNISAENAIRGGTGVHFWSLEMARQELTLRLLAAEARVPLMHLLRRELSDREWGRLGGAQVDIGEAPLKIFDPSHASLTDIRSELRAAERRKELPGLVVVDYLQLMTGTRRAENRQQEVSEIARGLKHIAGDFDLPVIALAQLGRGSEHRLDKRPIVADLRESGEIENSADVVILLHREDMYDKETPRAGEADIIVGKQRNGPQANVVTAWQGDLVRFVDIAPESWRPSNAAGAA